MEQKTTVWKIDCHGTFREEDDPALKYFGQTRHEIYNEVGAPLEECLFPVSAEVFYYKVPTRSFKKREDIPEGLYSAGGAPFVSGWLVKDTPKDRGMYLFYDHLGIPRTFGYLSENGTCHRFWEAFSGRYGTVSSETTCGPYGFRPVDLSVDPVLKDFADYEFPEDEVVLVGNSSLVRGDLGIYDVMKEFFIWETRIQKEMTTSWDLRFYLFSPIISVKSPGSISLYQNLDKRNRDLHTPMKPGKAFRKMFPEANDREVEKFVDLFRERCPVQELTVHEGLERKDFKHMYTHDICGTENIRTTGSRKSLACSCMRYDFGSVHPSEAYASGDFVAFWTEDKDGKIGSRCVASKADMTWGPVYGTTEYSVTMLEEHMEKLGYKSGYDGEESWGKGKMLAIPYEGDDCYVFPYVDFGYVPKEEDGGYLIIGVSDDCLPTEGFCYLGGGSSRYYCEDCSNNLHEESVYHDSHGYCYCEECYYDRYSRCDHCGEETPREDLVEAVRGTRWGNFSDQVCEYCAENHYVFVESHEGYYSAGLCIFLEDSNEHVLKSDSDLWFQSDITGEYYSASSLVEGTDSGGNTIHATAGEFEEEGYVYDENKDKFILEEEEAA